MIGLLFSVRMVDFKVGGCVPAHLPPSETHREPHRGVVDIRGRRDFSRFDPSPGDTPL